MSNAKITQDELQAIKERLKAVGNYGEWMIESDEEGRVNQAKVVADTYTVAIELDEQDAEFIAHARQDIPRLVAEVERLQNDNSQYYDKIKRLKSALLSAISLSNECPECINAYFVGVFEEEFE